MSLDLYTNKISSIASFKVKIENFSKDHKYKFINCINFELFSNTFTGSVYFIPYPSRKQSLITLRICRNSYTNYKIYGTLSVKNHQQFINFKPNEITKSFQFLSCNEIFKNLNDVLTEKDLILNFDLKVLNLEEMYFQMMTMTEFADLTFVSLDAQKFLVYRGVVKKQSVKLKALIEVDNEVIFNTSGAVLKEFISFIHTGKANILNEVAFDLLKLTHEFDIQDFWRKYNDEIISMVTLNNVIDFLFFADDTKNKMLKKFCLKFIKRNFSIVRTQIDIQSTSRAFSLLMKYYEIKYYNKRIFIGSLFD